MEIRRRLRLWSELTILTLALGGINLLFPQSVGFLRSPINPYLIASLLVAAYYGRYPGFLVLSWSVVIVLLPLPPLMSALAPGLPAPGLLRGAVLREGLVPLAVAVVGVYVLGFIRDANSARLERTLERLRRSIREKIVLERRTKALSRVNAELEERVYRQSDSLTALYSQVQTLHSYDLRRGLQALLEIIERFARATSASVWEYRHQEKELRLVADRGTPPEGRSATVLPVGDSIEGWVVRNDLMFSVRLLNRYTNLRELDDGRNIISLPIKAGSRMWGVLDIEAMPFERYNLHTERLLQVMMALVSPALDKAVENESALGDSAMNQHTGLPTYSQFHAILEKDIYRAELARAHLSVIILEIANADDLRAAHGDQKYYAVLLSLIRSLEGLTQGTAYLFHYQEESQLALLYPNLDFDGASLSCLEILSMISSTQWTIDEQPVSIDAIVGYASLGEKRLSAEELLDAAEHLLEMQKV